MGTVSVSLPSDGQTIDAADYNTPINTIVTTLNGNIDGDNITDSAVDSTKVNFGGSGAGIWWEEIGRTTLGTAGDTISVTPITAKKYLKVIVNAIATGGTINTVLRFNNDSGSNYSRRISDEGGADAIGVSQTGLTIGTTGAWNQLAILDITNIAASEKLVIGQQTGVSTSGAGAAPRRQELTGKWANTSDQITRVDSVNGGTGDYAIGSEVIVLGHD